MDPALQFLLMTVVAWFFVGIYGYWIMGSQRIPKNLKTPIHWTLWKGPNAYMEYLRKWDKSNEPAYIKYTDEDPFYG